MSLDSLLILGLAIHQGMTLWFNGKIFAPVRLRLMRWHPWLQDLVNCPLCLSVWCGAFVVGLWLVPYGQYLVWLLAAVEVSAFANVLIHRIER